MIYLYSGTPGSGKSYHSTYDIYRKLSKKKFNSVIANFPFNVPEKCKGQFTYVDNTDLTVDYLVRYAFENHELGLENQTLIVIDESQILFNSRNWNSNSHVRMDWIKFFSQHRKLGYNIILMALNDKMIDRQIRCLVEYEVSHMKMNNYFFFLPFSAFMCVTRWYGQRMKVSHEVIIFRKKIADLYDSYAIFDEKLLLQMVGGTHSVGGDPTVAIEVDTKNSITTEEIEIHLET